MTEPLSVSTATNDAFQLALAVIERAELVRSTMRATIARATEHLVKEAVRLDLLLEQEADLEALAIDLEVAVFEATSDLNPRSLIRNG